VCVSVCAIGCVNAHTHTTIFCPGVLLFANDGTHDHNRNQFARFEQCDHWKGDVIQCHIGKGGTNCVGKGNGQKLFKRANGKQWLLVSLYPTKDEGKHGGKYTLGKIEELNELKLLGCMGLTVPSQ
jgi:hypothetical protein